MARGIHDIVCNFIAGNKIEDSAMENALSVLKWADQKPFLESTILHPTVKQYPLKRSYVKIFLKKVISILEKSEDGVCDEIYESFCQFLNDKMVDENDNFCHKHYTIRNEKGNTCIITVKESPKLISEGTTGLRTWEAALVLAEWCLMNKATFKDSKVLELGSGMGLTGMIVAKLCPITNIWMSDCHTKVLDLLEQNILINFPDVPKLTSTDATLYKDMKSCIEVLNLDWNNVNEIPNTVIPDIVLGADIVYDPTVFPILCRLFDRIRNLNINARIILVSTIRNENTNESFLHCLKDNGFSTKIIPLFSPKYLTWDDTKMYQIIEINFF